MGAHDRGTDAETLSWPVQHDAWVVVVVGMALLGMLGSVVSVWLDPGATAARVPALVMSLVVLAGIRVLMVPLRYELTLDELRVRAGLTRSAIAWSALVRVEVVWSLVSNTTAGLSLRRVRLVGVRGRVLEVAPRDRLGFVAEVLARAPQLVEDASGGPQRAWHDPARERPRHRRRLV